MLTRIKNFFEQNLSLEPTDDTVDSDHILRLAISALLLEMTRMSDEVLAEERVAVEFAVRKHFDLSASEAGELLEMAEEERSNSTDYFQFTTLINKHYTPEQKVKLIELLWRIAYADDSLHRYEEHLVRKVAELLYVPHSTFIAIKHVVRGER